MSLAQILALLVKVCPQVLAELATLEAGQPVTFKVGPEPFDIAGSKFEATEVITVQNVA